MDIIWVVLTFYVQPNYILSSEMVANLCNSMRITAAFLSAKNPMERRHAITTVRIVRTIAIFFFYFSLYPWNSAHHCIDVKDQAHDRISTTIYGKFPDDHFHQKVSPGCKLVASWPNSYGDIFYGADDCLYDANGSSLNQCCSEPTSDVLSNP